MRSCKADPPPINDLLLVGSQGDTLGRRLNAWRSAHERKGEHSQMQARTFEYREQQLAEQLAEAGQATFAGIQYRLGKGGLITMGLPL